MTCFLQVPVKILIKKTMNVTRSSATVM